MEELIKYLPAKYLHNSYSYKYTCMLYAVTNNKWSMATNDLRQARYHLEFDSSLLTSHCNQRINLVYFTQSDLETTIAQGKHK